MSLPFVDNATDLTVLERIDSLNPEVKLVSWLNDTKKLIPQASIIVSADHNKFESIPPASSKVGPKDNEHLGNFYTYTWNLENKKNLITLKFSDPFNQGLIEFRNLWVPILFSVGAILVTTSALIIIGEKRDEIVDKRYFKDKSISHSLSLIKILGVDLNFDSINKPNYFELITKSDAKSMFLQHFCIDKLENGSTLYDVFINIEDNRRNLENTKNKLNDCNTKSKNAEEIITLKDEIKTIESDIEVQTTQFNKMFNEICLQVFLGGKIEGICAVCKYFVTKKQRKEYEEHLNLNKL